MAIKDFKSKIEIKNTEKETIKNNSPFTLPLNPSSQGMSAGAIRKKMYQAICGESGSVLALLEKLAGITKEEIEELAVGIGTDLERLEEEKASIDYVDTEIINKINAISIVDNLNEKIETGDNNTLQHSKTYADTKDAENLNAAKQYADTKDAENLDVAKQYAEQLIDDLINNAPKTYDTLKEIADYIAQDETFSQSILLEIANVKASKLDNNTYTNDKGLLKTKLESIESAISNLNILLDSVYTKQEVDNTLNNKADKNTTYTKQEVDNLVGDISVDLMINKTYEELKQLRDTSMLQKGAWYRITDYQTTTIQEDTRAANNVFDILVLATDTNKLSHEVRAIERAGNTYFSNNGAKLEKWRLMYDLDNDTNKYAWADNVNGKGVIYRMIDDNNNNLPYDFKNIQFKRYKITGTSKPATVLNDYVNKYYAYGKYMSNFTINPNDFKWCYTFHSDTNTDNSFNDTIKENTIKASYMSEAKLNNIVFFGNNCQSNTFGDSCQSNTFGDYCNSNTFGNDCHSNTFGNYCYSNTFGNNCDSNTFGNDCDSNTFGNDCDSNTFGNNCDSNTFGNNCDSNTFGNNCDSNTFGDSCQSNTFGNNCKYNTFGRVQNLGARHLFQYNFLGNNIKYIVIDGDNVKNIRIENGLTGLSSSNKLRLFFPELANKDYEIQVGKAADGSIYALWNIDPLRKTGKFLKNNTDYTWKDVR